MLGNDFVLFARGFYDASPLAIPHFPRALQNAHPRTGEQASDATGEAIHYRCFPALCLLPVERRSTGTNAQRCELAGAAYFPVELCRVNDGLRWNTSGVQTGAARLVALDQQHIQTKLSRTQCATVAAGPAPQNQHLCA